MQTYKGYTIQPDFRNPYSNKPELMFYPTEEGVQHDGDYDDGWKYCGNCKWASTVEEAKDEIDELTITFEQVAVCPHCGALSEEKFSGDEGWSFCSDGCGCIEGDPSVYKFECSNCHELCDEEKCNCVIENHLKEQETER